MYNNYQQPQQVYQTNRPIYQQTMLMPYAGLKGRPVASIEEARGSIIDFDGSIFYFPDLANKRIYTKQINMDGTALLNVYELKEIPIEAEPKYVTREEFDAVLAQLQQFLAPQTAPEAPAPASKPAAEPLIF